MSLKKSAVFVIICIVTGTVLYLFSPVGTGNHSLNERQTESLCSAFAGEPESEYDGQDVTCQAAVKIFGVTDRGSLKTIYGYVSGGEYLKYRNKAYNISGGNYEFMVDVSIHGDDVKIIKTYGDGVSSESTYEEMPFRYRFQLSHYDAYDSSGYCKIAKEADRKAENVLGVPIETKYTLQEAKKSFE